MTYPIKFICGCTALSPSFKSRISLKMSLRCCSALFIMISEKFIYVSSKTLYTRATYPLNATYCVCVSVDNNLISFGNFIYHEFLVL